MEVIDSSMELARVIFLLGALLALLYKKQFGATPGGIIVPGTLAVVLCTSWLAFALSLTSAVLCWLIYYLLFGKYALTGRWPALINISISVILGLILVSYAKTHAQLDEGVQLLSMITPGLIAISARKYGLSTVVKGTLLTTFATVGIGSLICAAIPRSSWLSLNGNLATYQELGLTNVPIVLGISLVTAIFLYTKFKTRGAGYLISPFVAVVLTSSLIQSLMLAISVFASYFIVRLVQKHTLIIGLERFVLSLFCGYLMVSIMDVLASQYRIAGYRPSALVLIIAIAVMTNDLCLQPLKSSLFRGINPALTASYLTRLAV